MKGLQGVTSAVEADMRALAVRIFSPRGRVRKNGPCLCDSGKKYKKCCYPRVRAGEIPAPLVRGEGIPTVRIPPTAKLRYLLRKALKALKEEQ